MGKIPLDPTENRKTKIGILHNFKGLQCNLPALTNKTLIPTD